MSSHFLLLLEITFFLFNENKIISPDLTWAGEMGSETCWSG